jgi:hypothetical protein
LDFLNFLKSNLPSSSETDRIKWANEIISQDLDLASLTDLYNCDYKIASRYLWLLSSIGDINSKLLLNYLPALLELRRKKAHKNTEGTFANFWLIAGVPIINESEAINLLFEWINSSKVNVTGKSRSMQVLYILSFKYPELKQELKVCLESQLDKNTSNYQDKVKKTLEQLTN